LSDADLSDRICLDPAIRPSGSTVDAGEGPKAILVTGATGFLGGYLVKELAHQTQATLYCLVRAKDEEAGMGRIREGMTFYQIWDHALASRIVPVIGDLSAPRLGLGERSFEALAGEMDALYHAGAQVNAVYPYARLMAANVSGTEEMLRLAALGRTKPLHLISTLAVFFGKDYQGQQIIEGEPPDSGQGLQGGYKQTKWAAEGLIRQARQRGLPATIYRPGRIMGDSGSGIIERYGDLLGNLLQACLHIGLYPQVDTRINFAPVDYVSRAIAHLSGQREAQGGDFHLHNPASIRWNDLWEIIAALGYRVEGVEYGRWRESIFAQAQDSPERKLFTILRHLLRSPIHLFSDKPEFSTSRTLSGLAGSGIECPPVDQRLMAVYLNYLSERGYIPAPEAGNPLG
jgi:thioester reductase-like protein